MSPGTEAKAANAILRRWWKEAAVYRVHPDPSVQEGLKRDLFAGDLYVFRARRGDLLECLWRGGLGLSLYSKRLDRGHFLWPSTAGDSVGISPAQLGYLLEGIDWRNPQQTRRPSRAG